MQLAEQRPLLPWERMQLVVWCRRCGMSSSVGQVGSQLTFL